jgi:DNA-binding NtrC family response regulator
MALILACRSESLHASGAIRALEAAGHEVVACGDVEALLELLIRRRPHVVIHVMNDERTEDLGLLRLFRRVAPQVGLILITETESLSMRREVLDLRPIYSAVQPVGETELLEAVDAAVSRPGPSARARGVKRAH